jgi:hypothetical protein
LPISSTSSNPSISSISSRAPAGSDTGCRSIFEGGMPMIEVTYSYDFLPNIDDAAYARLAKRANALLIAAPGMIEFRAHRNMLGSPMVRRTSVWASLSEWATFAESPDWQAITAEFRTYVTNLEVIIWGPSPLLPNPVRP